VRQRPAKRVHQHHHPAGSAPAASQECNRGSGHVKEMMDSAAAALLGRPIGGRAKVKLISNVT
jgi:hypothetical protein